MYTSISPPVIISIVLLYITCITQLIVILIVCSFARHCYDVMLLPREGVRMQDGDVGGGTGWECRRLSGAMLLSGLAGVIIYC